MSAPTNNIYSPLLSVEAIFGPNAQLEKRMINSAQGQVQYIGFNLTPNALTSSPTWAIAKCLYDGNGYLNRYQIPASKGYGFYYIWDDVTTYF